MLDDDASIRRFILYLLTDAGYQATGAAPREFANTALANVRPDLVLLDARSASQSGSAFLDRFRCTFGPQAALLLMTTTANDLGKVAALRPDGLLMKPFDLDDLERLIKQMTESRRT